LNGTLELTLRNEFSELGRVQPLVREFLDRNEVSETAAYTVELAIEEVVTNIIKYAFPDAGTREIRVGLTVEQGRVVLRFEDDGAAFDPSRCPQEDSPGTLTERRAGGLGLRLMHSLVDGIEYRRSGGRNRLQVWVTLFER
jgi:anti-sigma regulatory factor (Ser/Thr protein kinase)